MPNLAILFADGCEEIEGLTVVDICRRAGFHIDMISINPDNIDILGAHNIPFECDEMFEDVNITNYDAIILPGGGKGTENLKAFAPLPDVLKNFIASGKLVAAICAAPSVLGVLGLLKERKATCYPGFEEQLEGAIITPVHAITDGNIITGQGMGAALDFSLEIVRYFTDTETVEQMKKTVIY